MRTLAIGDIHGCSKALEVLLAEVSPTPDDLIITLGDYIDRGPDSFGVIERILELRKECRVVSLRGNHDLMMLEARKGNWSEREWNRCGGRETLESYSAHSGDSAIVSGSLLQFVPAHHWQFFEETCVNWFETETHFFVHANADPDVPLPNQTGAMLFWQKLYGSLPHFSGKTMICGHTAQRNGKPLNLGHAICIDTWVYGDGWLTCLDVENRIYWQANQPGQTRMANLDRLSRR